MSLFTRSRHWAGALAASSALSIGSASPSSPAPPPTVTVRSGDNVAEIDRTGKGAVLCARGILAAAWAAGRLCYGGQDAGLQAEMEDSLDRIDKFVVANSRSRMTMPQLAADRKRTLSEFGNSGAGFCDSDAAKLYRAYRSRGIAALHVSTTALLSIPREPVMNPCL